MTRHISENDVRAIAAYTHIGIEESQIGQLTTDLNRIIDSLAPITEYELEGIEPTYHPIGGLSNIMREDIGAPSFTQEEALSNSSSTEDGSFLIPAILGGGDAS